MLTVRQAAWWLVLAGVALGVALAAGRPPADVIALMSEEGPVERLTAITLFAVAPVVWLLRRRADATATPAALSLLFVFFGARELDWHKVWTGTSVLRVSYYYGPAPLLHKAVALAALSVFAAVVGWLVLRHARRWWQALRAGDAVAHSVAAFIAAIVLAKALDRSYSVLTEDFGLGLSVAVQAGVNAIEECLELTLSAIAVLALWQNRQRPSSPEAP